MNARLLHIPISLILMALFSSAILSSCDFLGLNDDEGDEGESNIEWKSQVILFEGLQTLVLQDTSGGVYSFDKDQLDEADIDIKPGKVLVIEDHSLVKVVSVEETQLGIDVVTSPAVLTDAIRNGELNFSKVIKFSEGSAPELYIDATHRVSPKITRNGSISYETEIDGLTIKMSLTPGSGSSEISLSISDSEDRIAMVGTGMLTEFRVDQTMNIINGRTDGWDFNATDYRADMTVQMAAGLSGPSEIALRLPEALELKIPIPVAGPIPVYIGVGFKLVATIDVPRVLAASSTMESQFSYSGTQGFSYSGTSLDFSGQAGNVEFGQFSSTSGALPGAQVGLTFGPVPSFGLYIFGSQVAFIDARFIAVSQFLITPPPISIACREAAILMKITGGFKLEMMGITLASGEHDFYEDYAEERTSSCPDNSSFREDIEGQFGPLASK